MGTPGLTSRGMKEKEMKLIASWIDEVLKGIQETKKRLKIDIVNERKRSIRLQIVSSTKLLQSINQKVKKLCKKFPIKRSY